MLATRASDAAPGRSTPFRPARRATLAGAAVALACAVASASAGADDAPSGDARDAAPGFAGALPEAAAPERAPALAPPDAVAGSEPDPQAVLTVLDASAQFGRGGAALAAEARVVVERLAERLAALERVLSVRVIGHADSVGEEADNLALSERRARSVANAFRERWPDVHTLAVGAGESAPIADNATESGRALNRRVEIQVIGIGISPTAD